jgi:hypothetical protein
MSDDDRWVEVSSAIIAAGLKAIKKTKDISESEQIRQALNDWLTKHGVATSRPARKRATTRKRA